MRTRFCDVMPVCLWLGLLLTGSGFGLFSGAVQAQEVTDEQLQVLTQERDALVKAFAEWQEQMLAGEEARGSRYSVNGQEAWSDVADVAVLVKGVDWAVRHREFAKKGAYKQTVQAVEEARKQMSQLQKGTREYQPGSQICGYQSEVDHSFQPYALTLPANFTGDRSRAKRWPLYVVLHGRGGMNEVGFFAKHRQKAAPAEQDWIQIDVFGRIDNAYRWAGETDVFEALRDVSRRFAIDDHRVVLWGFSMGGAGAWHLGLHYPDRWAAVGAGAGFVDFYRYQKKTEPLPDHQHQTLSIYDALGYARNLHNMRFVTYGGDQDSQILASQLMQEQAEKLEVPLKFIIGKEIGHKFTPEASAEFQAFLKQGAEAGRARYPGPKEVRFITFTPKYNQLHWLTVEELEQMYAPATVDSQYEEETATLKLETQNVAVLAISRDIASSVELDGEPAMPLADAADNLLPNVYYMKRDAGWELLDYDDSRAYQEFGTGRKTQNLQGPIDDAFMQPFLCVRGTGTPLSAEHEAWAQWTLARFEKEFDKWMRGHIQIVNDTDVTPEMINRYHLVLFGDPGSNKLIAQMQDKLPVSFDADSFTIGDKDWNLNEHGLALISPNPLNRRKYVVLNSGMTTHEQDFKASNAWLFPKLGDAAVLKFSPEKTGFKESTEWAILFDENWDLPGSLADEE